MSEQKQISSLSILGVLLALGLMAAAFILGVQFKNLRQPDNYRKRFGGEKLPIRQRDVEYGRKCAWRELSGSFGFADGKAQEAV